MNGMRLLASVLVAALLVPVLAWANGGRPPFPGPDKPIPENMGKTLSSKKAQYMTTFDPKAKRTKLVIPQKFIAASARGSEKDAPAKDGTKTGASASQTVVAGTALSLCLVSGGLWLSRRGTGSLGKGKTALLIAIGTLGVSMIAASALFADIATFPPKDKGKGIGPGPGGFVMPKVDVDIEITEKGDTVYLVLPGAGFGGGGGGGFGVGGGFGGGFPVPPPPKDAPKKNSQEE